MGDAARVTPVQQERRVTGGGAPQGEGGDRAHRAAPGQVARVADEVPERQPGRGHPSRVTGRGGGQLVGQRFADVHAVEVPAGGQVQVAGPRDEARAEEPVAGPVVEQRRRVKRGESVGVDAVARAVGVQRPHVGGRVLGAADGRRGRMPGPVQLHLVQAERLRRDPLLTAQQHGRTGPRRIRVEPAGRLREWVAVLVQAAPFRAPAGRWLSGEARGARHGIVPRLGSRPRSDRVTVRTRSL